MELDGAASKSQGKPGLDSREPPRASEWLWRPWYAKLWWALILIYWSGRLLSLVLPLLEPLYANALAGYLNILFFPPTLLIALGIGFVGEWMDYYRWEWVATPDAGLQPRRSEGGFRDPYSDPLDLRSGAQYWRHRYGQNWPRH